MAIKIEKMSSEKVVSETPEPIAQRRERLRYEIADLDEQLTKIKLRLNEVTAALKEDNDEKTNDDLLTEAGGLNMERHRISDELDAKKQEEEELAVLMDRKRSFDKYALFRNIRELLKTSNMKLGQIEKDAGLNPGYMSRLEKLENATDPSLEFVITAARDLGVSVDYLIHSNLDSMSATDRYTYNFLDRLKMDTLQGELEWMTDEVVFSDSGRNKVMHPLLTLNTDVESSYVSKYIFKSHTFGTDTTVDGDCFRVQINTSTYLYLMSISKAELNMEEKSGVLFKFAIELWMLLPDGSTKYICSDQDEGSVGNSVDVLYAAVRDYVNEPKVDDDVMGAIDAYMNKKTDDVKESPEELMARLKRLNV